MAESDVESDVESDIELNVELNVESNFEYDVESDAEYDADVEIEKLQKHVRMIERELYITEATLSVVIIVSGILYYIC